jgi:CBS domain-containing protein
MSTPAITVGVETSVQEVARVMREQRISGVPVVSAQGELLGLVSELDLIARNAPLRQPSYFAVLSGLIPIGVDEHRRYREQLQQVLATSAGELMGHDDLEQIAVTPETGVDEAMARMLDPQISTLVVVDNNAVIGVVTRTDIVGLLEGLESTNDE